MTTFKDRLKAILHASELSLEGLLVYVIFNNSAGLYVVDTYYDEFSDEKIDSVYFNGLKQ